MQKLCFAQKRSCFPFGLPRYLSPTTTATTTTTSRTLHPYLHRNLSVFVFSTT